MKTSFSRALIWGAFVALAGDGARAQTPTFRPPSVPLVVNDPYLSIWSNATKLTDTQTQHWTRREHALSSLIRVDGKPFRLMGTQPQSAPAFRQTSLRVTPTSSIYRFENAGIHLTFSFLTPFLPNDLDVLARPATYLTWSAQSSDGRAHRVEIYLGASSQLAVNTPAQTVVWAREKMGKLAAVRVGTQKQSLLRPAGDDVRINWGYAYLAATGAQTTVGASAVLQSHFSARGALPKLMDARQPRASDDAEPTLACAFDLGKVGQKSVERHAILAYDQIYSINYFGQKLRPYWRRSGDDASAMLQKVERDYPALVKRCAAFDRELMADATQAGGEKYAQICALAFRQAIGATGIAADAGGAPLVFPKENSSNGDIATVDVFFPMSPIFLLTNPLLVKAMMVPIFDYSASPRWKFPNAPHDLGDYPVVMGRDGGGEAMPVEESGNMLILLGALSKVEGNTHYADRYWPTITKWANYLISKGYDLDNQLSTDDFAGHLAHNTNLSGKSIESLGAYAMMCRMRGDNAEATRVRAIAEGMSQQWMTAALDGDHYKLAFDKSGTWSQKYNLVWDNILGLNLFPRSVATTEMAYYKTRMNRYGLPLDSRESYTKLDWTLWSAALTGDKADVVALAGPAYDFLNDTTSRVPMTDWYRTIQGTQVGFQARSVVGGVFIPVLNNPQIWSKWAQRDIAATKNLNLNWAPLPPPLQITEIVPTSAKSGLTWNYTTSQPTGDWFAAGYDASGWQTGAGGFGSQAIPGPIIGTAWDTPDIWARREFTLTADQLANRDQLQLLLYHDDEAEVYINGVSAFNASGSNNSYEQFQMTKAALASLKPGKNVLAVHVHDSGGDQYLDAGLATVK